MKTLLLIISIFFSLSCFSQNTIHVQLIGGIQVAPIDSVLLDTTINEVSWLIQKDTSHYWDIYNQNNVLRNHNVKWKQVAVGWKIIMRDYVNSSIFVVDGFEMIITGKGMITIIYRLNIDKNYLNGNWLIRSEAQPRWGY